MNLQEATMKALRGKLRESSGEEGPLFKIGYQAGMCPNCGKPISDYGDIDWYDDQIGQEFVCHNCDHKGTEYFNIKFNSIELYGNNANEIYKQD